MLLQAEYRAKGEGLVGVLVGTGQELPYIVAAQHVLLARLGILPAVALSAVVADYGGLGLHGRIYPGDGRLGVGAAVGYLEEALQVHVDEHVGGGVLHALGALEGLYGHKVLIGIGVLPVDHVDSARERAHQGRFVAHGLLELAALLGKGGGVDQALGVELVQIAQRLAELFLVGLELYLAVNVGHVLLVAAVIVDLQEGVEEAAGPAGHAAERYLVGLAVAVGILGLEGHQHVIELVGGRGHGQVKLIQPIHVDIDLGGSAAVAALGEAAYRVDVAVRSHMQVVVLGAQRVQLGQAGRIGDEVAQRYQHAFLHAVGHYLAEGEGSAFSVGQEDIRIVAAGQQQLLLGGSFLRGEYVAGGVQAHAGLFLQVLQGVVLGVVQTGIAVYEGGDHDGFRARIGQSKRGNQRQHHSQHGHNGKHLFHGFVLLFSWGTIY